MKKFKLKSVLLSFSLFFMLSGQVVSAHSNSGYSHDSTIGYENKDWMSRVNGQSRLSELSIPGTHDSASFYGGDAVQTQSMSLPTQLNSGIRFLDIRCRYLSDTVFAIHHGPVYQNTMFGNVINDAIDFLKQNPTETILMRVKQEYSSVSNNDFNKTFMSYVNKNKNWFWDNGGNNHKNPTLDEVRGKIVVLYDVLQLNFGINYRTLSKQDNHSLSTNWDLYNKWEGVKNHLDKANANPNDGITYLNYLVGSGGAFPYFVASGHSNPATGAPRLATGLTTPGWNGSYPDFPRVDNFLCFSTIAFEGINTLTTDKINNSKYSRVGIVTADFPGSGFIDSVINVNKLSMKEGVYLYEHGDFGGRYVRLTEDAPSAGDLLVGNDSVSSIKIVGPYQATVYEHGNFEGTSFTYTADDNWLENDPIGNDKLSSIKVTRK